MTVDPFAEWSIEESAFPAAGAAADKLAFLLRYAILAPSSHNTQPWRFHIHGDVLDVLADRRRRLPVVDPEDRALTISCGAAIGVLRCAMRRFGHAGWITLLPDFDEPDLLASVTLGEPHAPSAEELARFGAITRRRSTRLPYRDEPFPAGLADALAALAAEDGVEVGIVTETGPKSAVAALVGAGDRAQFADPAFRAELGHWIHSRHAASRDGISGANFGMPDRLSNIGALVVRTFDMGSGVGAKDEQIAIHSPALALFATPGDSPRDWLMAGMAHVEGLLAICAAGLTAAYLNQPVEVPSLRPRLRTAARVRGIPQLLIRAGRGPAVAPAVRRPLRELVEA